MQVSCLLYLKLSFAKKRRITVADFKCKTTHNSVIDPVSVHRYTAIYMAVANLKFKGEIK